MNVNELIPSLGLFTLVAVALAAGVGLALFKRKRSNRHPMARSPDGAIMRTGEDQTPRPLLQASGEPINPSPTRAEKSPGA